MYASFVECFRYRRWLPLKIHLTSILLDANIKSMEHLTKDNWNEQIKNQEFRDFLSSQPHPVQEMDDSGYTYLDYVLFKTKQFNRPIVKIMDEINKVIDSKGKIYQWSNGKSFDVNIN